MPSFLQVLRDRRSVRHFSAEIVPEARIARLVETAAWAPSGGNEQPWAVTALRPETARRYLGPLERLAWNALFPKLMGMVERRAPGLAAEQAVAATRTLIEDEGLTRGAPWLLLIHAPEPSSPEPQTLQHLHALLAGHLPAEACPTIDMLAETNGPINRGVVRASAICFTYALSLAAEADGLGACIQHSPLLFTDRLRDEFGLPREHALVSTLLVGFVDAEDPVNARIREQARRAPVSFTVR